MFRRLAESFQSQDPHLDYIQQQDVFFKTVSNIIPSASSGLKGFENAIQTVDTTGQNLQPTAIPYPDEIFRSTISPDLQQFSKQCSTSSIDQLIAIKNPSLTTGCGWLYTPPNQGSPYPQVSQGFIGNEQGPLSALNPPEYKKWFFDLQLAKKQMLIDKCKALKACTDVDSNVFKGTCGFCTDTNQGVPIDNVGKPLYVNDDMGGCNTSSMVLSGDRCPKMDADSGPQPLLDRTCEPVDGKLSSSCLYRQVISGGCSDNGALAIALSNPSSSVSLRIGDSVKIYNRVANPPLNIDIFRQGRGTINEVLNEVRQLASNMSQSDTSALGASARELCLQKGSIQKYDMCLELSDSSVSPFDLKCLQQLFLKMGGQPKGTMYPSANTLPTYNAMNNLGAVKQYLHDLISKIKNNDYNTQRDAMMQFLGITPEGIVKRVPYQQGVEVFWFVPATGNPNKVTGFLRRTIERDIVQIPYGVEGQSGISQIDGNVYAAMVQLTDLRAPSDFSARFRVTVDDGFWIAVNQPNYIDKTAMNQADADSPGLFENLRLQGATTYTSTQCSDFSASTPNIVKMYYENAGGGGFVFTLNVEGCGGQRHYFQPPNYSLTCESRAPFLNYEVNLQSNVFEETRNPGLFSQFLGLKSLDSRVRPEERNNVPGNKGFVRINNLSSLIDIPNIAYQSWKTVTFAIRLYTMPVKDTLIKFAVGSSYLSVIVKPINGSTAGVSIEHNFNRGNTMEQSTNFKMSLNKWYLVGVHNWGTGMTLFINGIDEMVANKGYADGVRVDKADGISLYRPNGTWSPAPGQPNEACTIMLGTNGFLGIPSWGGMYATSAFQYDLAWIHFFQQMAGGDDIYRECMVDWKYTQFPKSYNNYRS